MTLPIAANVDPALRARIASALTGIGEEAGSVIARVAEAEAKAGGNTGGAWIRCAHLLGRSIVTREIAALEACIRAHLEAGTSASKPFDADVCGYCRNGNHARCSALTYPDLPAAACVCKHDRAGAPMGDPPRVATRQGHPTPEEMAREAYRGGRDSIVGVYARGVAAERARMVDLLLALASARLDTAKGILDAEGDTMEAVRLNGEARALRELAEGLR